MQLVSEKALNKSILRNREIIRKGLIFTAKGDFIELRDMGIGLRVKISKKLIAPISQISQIQKSLFGCKKSSFPN